MKAASWIIALLLGISIVGNVIMINKYRVCGDEMNTEKLQVEELRAEKAEMEKQMEKIINQVTALESDNKKLMMAISKTGKKK